MTITPEAKALVEALWCYQQLPDGWAIAQGHLDAYAEKRAEEKRIALWCEEEKRRQAEFGRLLIGAVMKDLFAPPATASSSRMDTVNIAVDTAGALY